MTYEELIDNVRDLGFSDDAEMEEFGELVYNSINRAVTEINMSVAPIIERYEFSISGVDEGYLYITMSDVADDFLDFADTPVLFSTSSPVKVDDAWIAEEKPVYKVFNNYQIEGNDTIVINADEFRSGSPQEGTEEYEKAELTTYSIRICYKAAHTPVTEDNTARQIELPTKVHHLVPLLTAYFVWLEDEPTKAAQYYNLYEQMADEIKLNSHSNKPRMRVLLGGM